MGDASSKVDSQEDPTAQARASNLHARFAQKSIDGKSAIESVFADDSQALEEIVKIVEELESGNLTALDPSEQKRAEERAKTLEQKARKAEASAIKKAEAQADSWFQRQLQEGLIEKAKAKLSSVGAEAQEAKKRADAADEFEASAVQEVLEKQIAKAEQAARCALLATAARPFTKYSASCIIGLSLLDMPVPIPPAASNVDGVVPVPPSMRANSRPAEKVPEFYLLLNVSVDATFDEVKKGYRREALKWHPDKNRDKPEVAAERFKRISEAFDTLYDPERRAAYDSGSLQVDPGRLKKLAGHGWSNLADDDDLTLTPLGLKWKKQSWRGYVLMYGRLDDDPADIIQDEADPRAPEIKLKVFWRFLAEMAHLDREEGIHHWMDQFIAKVWKDTPSKWPKASELQSMNEASQQEWKERRMVFNRRRQKLRVYIELHEHYLAIPDREKKEVERIAKRNPVWVRSFGMDTGAGVQRTGADKAERSSSHLRM